MIAVTMGRQHDIDRVVRRLRRLHQAPDRWVDRRIPIEAFAKKRIDQNGVLTVRQEKALVAEIGDLEAVRTEGGWRQRQGDQE